MCQVFEMRRPNFLQRKKTLVQAVSAVAIAFIFPNGFGNNQPEMLAKPPNLRNAHYGLSSFLSVQH